MVHKVLSTRDKNRPTPRPITLKSQNTGDKDKMLVPEQDKVIYKASRIRIALNFSTTTPEAAYIL